MDEIIPENQSALLDPTSLQDDLLWDSSKQIPEQIKVFSWSPVFHLFPLISGSHTPQSHGYCCPQPSHPWSVFPFLQVQGPAEYVPSFSSWSPIRKLLSMHSRNLMDCLCPDVLSFQQILGCLAGCLLGSGPATERLLPNIWRQLCLIPHSLQQTSTPPPHVLVCPLTLICKLSADSHLSQSRSPAIPTSLTSKEQLPRLTMVWPS